jgi:hypothetical protein
LPEQQLLEDPNKDLFMQQDPTNIGENYDHDEGRKSFL